MTQEEQADMINEIFTRLREDERKTSEVCVKLDMVVDQMKCSTAVTDKFLEALDKRRITDEAREAKFWKAIAFLGGALIALALGKDPAKIVAEHLFGGNTPSQVTDAIPYHDDRNTICSK